MKKKDVWVLAEAATVTFTVAGKATVCSFAPGEHADPTPDELHALGVLERDGLASRKTDAGRASQPPVDKEVDDATR